MPTIAQILLEQGQRRADARRRQGDLNATMWNSLGQTVGQTAQAIGQYQSEAPEREMQTEIRGLQLQGLRDERSAAQGAAEVETRLRDLFSGEQLPEPQAIMALVGPERGSQIITALDALGDEKMERYKTQGEVIAATLAGMEALPDVNRAEVYPGVRQILIQRGIINAEDAPEAYDPNWFQLKVGFGRQPAKVGTREIRTGGPGGTETIQIVEDRPGQTFQSTPKPATHAVTVRGPGGRPIRKLVTEAELAAGVEEYREPRVGAQPSFQRIETVDEAGNPVIQFMTPEEVRAQGGVKTSPKTTAKASGPATVEAILGEIQALSDKINTSGGGPMSNVTGALRRGAASVNLDNEVSEYQALVEGFIPMIARAVGHTGVLTQLDVESVQALFPRVGDNKALSANKIARVKRIMTAMQDPSVAALGPDASFGEKMSAAIGVMNRSGGGGRNAGAGPGGGPRPDPLGIRR